MERDIFMSAKEAKVYGIVDLVAIENAPNSWRIKRNFGSMKWYCMYHHRELSDWSWE
jgi:hypothetical protein